MHPPVELTPFGLFLRGPGGAQGTSEEEAVSASDDKAGD